MRLVTRTSSYVRTLAVAFVLALSLVRPAAAVDYTDLWWNSLENGWGVNFVQADDFVFATFFVYGAALQPTWYSGQMTVDTNGIWSGPLYQTAGSYFGAPWNPAQRGVNQVGSVTFAPATSYAGTLTYNVGGVVVSKQIARQTLKTIVLGGSYFGGAVSEFFNCTDPANNGFLRYYTQIKAIQTTGGTIQLDFDTGAVGGKCTMVGAYVQDGQHFRLPSAAYTCDNGINTTASISQLKATSFGIEGKWIAGGVGSGCSEEGTFSAVLN
jgi:hypothetical protein